MHSTLNIPLRGEEALHISLFAETNKDTFSTSLHSNQPLNAKLVNTALFISSELDEGWLFLADQTFSHTVFSIRRRQPHPFQGCTRRLLEHMSKGPARLHKLFSVKAKKTFCQIRANDTPSSKKFLFFFLDIKNFIPPSFLPLTSYASIFMSVYNRIKN